MRLRHLSTLHASPHLDHTRQGSVSMSAPIECMPVSVVYRAAHANAPIVSMTNDVRAIAPTMNSTPHLRIHGRNQSATAGAALKAATISPCRPENGFPVSAFASE